MDKITGIRVNRMTNFGCEIIIGNVLDKDSKNQLGSVYYQPPVVAETRTDAERAMTELAAKEGLLASLLLFCSKGSEEELRERRIRKGR